MQVFQPLTANTVARRCVAGRHDRHIDARQRQDAKAILHEAAIQAIHPSRIANH